MVANPIQLEEALALALKLSPLDKVRLLERVAVTLETDLSIAETAPFQTFEGALAHLEVNLTDEDIAESRRDMLQNFPREDIDL